VTNATTFIVRNERDKAEARRYRRRKSGRPASPADVRECEINKVIDHVFGASLPDDDFGREVLYELLNQMALRGASDDEMRDCALDLLPELDDDDSLDIMVKKIGKGRKRGADQIARKLGVTYEMRTLLDLRTVGACDVTKKWRDAIQQQKESFDKRWRREQAGAAPQERSARRNKPWEAMGMGKTKYYALKKAAAAATQNDACEPVRTSYSSISSRPKQFEDAPSGPPSPAERDAPAPQRSPHCQASSFDQPEPESVVSEVSETYGAVFSGRDLATALRESHRARNALIKPGPLDADVMRRLSELDRIIETARRELEQRRS
jgi:hypothetical protein